MGCLSGYAKRRVAQLMRPEEHTSYGTAIGAKRGLSRQKCVFLAIFLIAISLHTPSTPLFQMTEKRNLLIFMVFHKFLAKIRISCENPMKSYA